MTSRTHAVHTIAAPGHNYTRAQSLAVLAVMIGASTTLSMVQVPFTQVVDPIRHSFGISDTQFSMLSGVLTALPAMLGSIGGGWLADRISRRRILLVIMAVWTLAAAWSALAPDFRQLALSRVVLAAAAGVKFPLAMTWINDAFRRSQRGRATGAFFVVLGVGPAIGGVVGGLVLQAAQTGGFAAWPLISALEPWRVTLLLLAAFNILVVPFVARLCDSRMDQDTVAATTAAARDARVAIGVIAAILPATCLLALADSANLAWLPTVLERGHDFTAAQVGLAFGTITTLGGVAGSIIGGALGDWVYGRWGTLGRLRACLLAALLSAPLLASYACGSASVLIGSLMANGVVQVTAMTLSYVAFQALLPESRRGFWLGSANALCFVAGAAGPTLVALVSDRLGHGAAALGDGVAIVTVVTLLIAAGLFAAAPFGLHAGDASTCREDVAHGTSV